MFKKVGTAEYMKLSRDELNATCVTDDNGKKSYWFSGVVMYLNMHRRLR